MLALPGASGTERSQQRVVEDGETAKKIFFSGTWSTIPFHKQVHKHFVIFRKEFVPKIWNIHTRLRTFTQSSQKRTLFQSIKSINWWEHFTRPEAVHSGNKSVLVTAAHLIWTFRVFASTRLQPSRNRKETWRVTSICQRKFWAVSTRTRSAALHVNACRPNVPAGGGKGGGGVQLSPGKPFLPRPCQQG